MQEILIAKGIEILAPVVFSLVSALVSWGLYELTKFIRTKTKNENVNDAVSHICHTVETTVHSLEQDMAHELKLAAANGKLSKEEGHRIKTMAIGRVKAQLPKKIIKTAKGAVNNIGLLIEDKIDKAVLELKRHP